MTQASLSPDLHRAPGAPASMRDARVSASPEASLWIIALTSAGLMVAALLLVVLLTRNVVPDASLGGFVSGIAIMIAALGVGALAYVLVTAKRQGLLPSAAEAPSVVTSAAPSGMHVVAALPADLGRRKRLELRHERSARSKQAQAIATVAVVPRSARPVAMRPPTPRPMPVQRPAPRPAPARVTSTRVDQPVPVRVAPSAPARMAPAIPARVAPPAAARTRPVTRPPIRMPRPQVRPPRPAAWPSRAPVVRMRRPPLHPSGQVALYQVHGANVRVPAPNWPR